MGAERWYERILNGRAGPWTAPIRGAFRAASAGYGFAVRRRNAYYDRPEVPQRVRVPVISVGNITVGGTGKTPMVMELVRRLQQRGARPAVVARGYGGRDGINDEQRMVQERCPGVIYVGNADRVAGARRAAELGADVIVLDDGFQHRRLARDLDIVLVDATCPFGYGHLLPRGLLREPVAALGRAGAVVLTRCDQVTPAETARIEECVRQAAAEAALLRCRHRVTSIRALDGRAAMESIAGRRVVLAAGIANPAAFEATMASLGAVVVGRRWWPDHHRYTAKDVRALFDSRRFPAHDAVLTTQKDAVKLAALPDVDAASIWVACVELEFLDDGSARLDDLLETALAARVRP